MKALIKLIIFFGLAIGLVLIFKDNNDVVMLVTGNERRTVSLLTAVVFLLVAFLTLYLLFRILSWILSRPKAVADWSEERHHKKDIILLERGWVDLLEGRHYDAEKNFLKLTHHTKSTDRQILANIGAARAVHAIGDYARRDDLLKDARLLSKNNPKLDAAVVAVQADLLIEQGQAHNALMYLEYADSVDGRQLHIKHQLLRAYEQTDQETKLLDTARFLFRKKSISKEEYMDLLDEFGPKFISRSKYDGAVNFYNSLSKEEKQLENIALAISRRFDQLEEYSKSSQALETSLNAKLSPSALAYYARAHESVANERLHKAQKWLNADANNPDLLLAIGQLCLANSLWGQAEKYLNQSLKIKDNEKIHALLGVLYDKQGEHSKALSHWRKASLSNIDLSAQDNFLFIEPADISNDPSTPPDVKNLEKPDDHFLENNVKSYQEKPLN
ncbi:heme biosynthesis HemY N-terminal domain-containing protein [Taylorella equigenitalis]|uniref:heme biosynthesis HemY N-terminal domain-containing protein n=1 Tax=Taylorella equigenitalis TaxID=29575 RepID=UPI00237D0CE2|nr:heme biosynthesis HemY N-terminal domain-containing protein [Taylorella equigenitalis]WDU51253.1 heme biosynthesis protein HemY [Taylorella equigenitalis]WDU54271.1 heme biosynthesis protein HemY [Taylorella equigenitalis]